MLPKIGQKSTARDVVTYHTFTRELMSRKVSDNNISKLKMIKEFLEDDQFESKAPRTHCRGQKTAEYSVDQSYDLQKCSNMQVHEKENEERTKKVRRQSLTSQARTSEHRDKSSCQKEKLFIFAVPDRFKLNQLLHGQGRVKKTIIRDLLDNSLRMNSQLYTHRIL